MSSKPRRTFLQLAGATLAAAVLKPAVALAADGSSPLDVKSFGAKGDGKTVDTPAVNKAIEAAAAAGGGTVRFPAGSYLCYSIRLKSNISLYLDQGAKIIAADSPGAGSQAPGAYDAAEPNDFTAYQDFGHSHWHNSLIWGEDLENVSILGPGLIWGKGLSRGAASPAWYPPAPWRAEDPGVGNKAIALKNCHNVTLRDFSILQGGHFGVLATGVDNFTCDNLKIDTNRDGIDIDCCRNVRVSNCLINSPADDAICPKSSYALGRAKPTEFVTISDCYVTGNFHIGSVLDGTYKPFEASERVSHTGRIKCGTESNGGFRNITITNCVFESCQGLALESVDGALLEDITVSNISMRDIVNPPIFLRLGSRMRGPKGVPVGTLRRVIISDLVCSNAASRAGCVISGIPDHQIEDVKLSNIFIQHRGGGAAEDGKIKPDEKETAYPEPTMFGSMPSHGFYIRHVKGIEMTNVEISAMKEDLRPAFQLEDVQGGDFSRIKASLAKGVPTFVLNKVEDFTLRDCKTAADTKLEKADGKTV